MKERLLLIDGLNLFLRCYAVVPELDANGNHVGALVGFLRCLRVYLSDVRPTKCIVVWDGKGGSTKRRGIFAEYKAGRKPHLNRAYDVGDSPEEGEANLKMQRTAVSRYLDLLGISQVTIDEIEADDVIAFIARHMFAETNKVIVSSDKDFFQLIDEHTIVYSPSMKVYYTVPIFVERFGVLPENYIYMKMLDGDKSDGIVGIDGIGQKKVVKLFPFLAVRPSTLEEVLTYARQLRDTKPKYKEIDEQRDRLIQNVQLMQLTIPIIGSQSIQAIRYALEKETKQAVMSELRLMLMRDGIQLKDADLFGAYREYNLRSQTKEETTA